MLLTCCAPTYSTPPFNLKNLYYPTQLGMPPILTALNGRVSHTAVRASIQHGIYQRSITLIVMNPLGITITYCSHRAPSIQFLNYKTLHRQEQTCLESSTTNSLFQFKNLFDQTLLMDPTSIPSTRNTQYRGVALSLFWTGYIQYLLSIARIFRSGLIVVPCY